MTDSDLFAQLARLKHFQLSLALDHANSPDTATTPTAPTGPTGGAFAGAGISPFNVAGLTSGSNSTAGGGTTPASTPAAAAGSSRGTGRNPTGGVATADPSLEDAGVSPEAAANKTKDRFAVKREQAAVMTAKLADLRAIMRDITTTARTLHSQAATNPAPVISTSGQPLAQPASLSADPSSTRPMSFLSPLAPSAIPPVSATSRSPALGLAPRGTPGPSQPTTSILSPNQTNGLTGSPEMVGGLMGPSADAGVWAPAGPRIGGRVVDR
ncbi:hypothetical protein BCR44DRAFT_332024 [Catenaria anguillulae PL171]|uniref:Uncharacterized protein n=1 Tax=Catenaria anguillulae PL171 TaxID=765915 RepID=A0A1Y2HN36_9FUNG|nr:hypothetical protein BCR44DRAFT_332024 [Catenaria anguillulae PL171]